MFPSLHRVYTLHPSDEGCQAVLLLLQGVMLGTNTHNQHPPVPACSCCRSMCRLVTCACARAVSTGVPCTVARLAMMQYKETAVQLALLRLPYCPPNGSFEMSAC
eukprot:scaffold57943_cov28-Tisochrysis_lutea.AAC.4